MNGQLLGIIRSTLQELSLGNAAGARRRLVPYDQIPELESLKRVVAHYSKDNSYSDSLSNRESLNELESCILGWRQYYKASYEEAGEFFRRSWANRDVWTSWSALGMGKVCSDLGWWNDSRRWLLESMYIARSESDLFRIAECAGALGEVFLRAGKPKHAWELFDLDKSLLPSGSEYRSRLENYRAICLSRNGFPELAEPLLWGAFYAECESDSGSANYSFASLASISWRHQDEGLMYRLKKVADERSMLMVGLPGGVWSLVKAYWCWRQGNQHDMLPEYLAEARQCFLSSYPIELYWTDALVAEFCDGPFPDRTRLDALIHRRHPDASELHQIPLDAFGFAWGHIDLHTGCGFATLADKHGESLWKILDLLFV